MFSSRVRIRAVESSKLKEKERFNAESTETTENTEKKIGAPAAAGAPAFRDDCPKPSWSRALARPSEENTAQNEKGQNRVNPQFYPKVSIPQLKRFASAIFSGGQA
jgi:hypothetical protein